MPSFRRRHKKQLGDGTLSVNSKKNNIRNSNDNDNNNNNLDDTVASSSCASPINERHDDDKQQDRLRQERDELFQRCEELESFLRGMASQLETKQSLLHMGSNTDEKEEHEDENGNNNNENVNRDHDHNDENSNPQQRSSLGKEHKGDILASFSLDNVWKCLETYQQRIKKMEKQLSEQEEDAMNVVQALSKERNDLALESEMLKEQQKLVDEHITKAMRNMQDRIEELEDQTTSEDKLFWLKTDYEQLQAKHKKSQETHSELLSTHDRLQADHAKLYDRFQTLETQALALLDEFELLDEERDQWATQCKSKEDAFLIMMQHETALKSKVKNLETHLEDLKHEHKELKNTTEKEKDEQKTQEEKGRPKPVSPEPSPQNEALISTLKHKCQNLEHQCLLYTETIQNLKKEVETERRKNDRFVLLQKRCDGQVVHIKHLEDQLLEAQEQRKQLLKSQTTTPTKKWGTPPAKISPVETLSLEQKCSKLEQQVKSQAARIHHLEASNKNVVTPPPQEPKQSERFAEMEQRCKKLQQELVQQENTFKIMTIQALSQVEESRLELERICEEQAQEIAQLKASAKTS